MTIHEKAKEMIGERKHYRTLGDALVDAAYAASKWSYKQTDSIFTKDELSRLGLVMDLEKPLESSTYYILTIEGAIGVSNGYEYETKWLFLPVEPVVEPEATVISEITQEQTSEPAEEENAPVEEQEDASVEEPIVSLEETIIQEEPDKAVDIEPMEEPQAEEASEEPEAIDIQEEEPETIVEMLQEEAPEEGLQEETGESIGEDASAEESAKETIEEPAIEAMEQNIAKEAEEFDETITGAQEETAFEEVIEPEPQQEEPVEAQAEEVSKEPVLPEEDYLPDEDTELDSFANELLEAAEKMAKERNEAVCHVCGQKIQPGMDYCIYCGAPLEEDEAEDGGLGDASKANFNSLIDSLANELLEDRQKEQEAAEKEDTEEASPIELVLPSIQEFEEVPATEDTGKNEEQFVSEPDIELQDVGPIPFFKDPDVEPEKEPLVIQEEPLQDKKEEETGRTTLSLGVVCSKCGKQLKPEDRFCTDCGTPVAEVDPQVNDKVVTRKKLEQETLPCPVCGKPVKVTNKFCMFCGSPVGKKKEASSVHCIKCGAVLKDGYKFCIKCGTRQE